MNDIAIKVHDLGKSYRINHQQAGYRTLRESITELAASPFRKIKSRWAGNPVAENEETLWALKDINLDINKGEIVGIIGRNGAGKSTLLKILSNVTKPTLGYAEIHGRVGSLLEIGAGFHPELTGLENIYLNGAILGMKRSEIYRKLDEIVAFSEIERFIDTPVKHYSSGMYMRLAFAVAAHLDTEILLVDEVLAVGDLKFHQKCIQKMSEISRSGQTILVISHNLQLVETIADQCVYLKNGLIENIGDTKQVIKEYQKDVLLNLKSFDLPLKYQIKISNPVITISDIELKSQMEDKEVAGFETDTPIKLIYTIESKKSLNDIVCIFVICKDKLIISGNKSHNKIANFAIRENIKYRITVSMDGLSFIPGKYSIALFVLPNNYTGVESSLSDIQVKDFIISGSREFGGGYISVKHSWKVTAQ